MSFSWLSVEMRSVFEFFFLLLRYYHKSEQITNLENWFEQEPHLHNSGRGNEMLYNNLKRKSEEIGNCMFVNFTSPLGYVLMIGSCVSTLKFMLRSYNL